MEKYTHKILFKGWDVEPILITEEFAKQLNEARNNTPGATFELNGSSHNLDSIKHIIHLKEPQQSISWRICSNLDCPYGKHQGNEHCDLDITGSCQDCQKPLTHRAMEYLRYKGYRTLCRHCLLGTPPIEERYDMSDPEEAAEAREVAKAEGFEFGRTAKTRRSQCIDKGIHDLNRKDKCIWCGFHSQQIGLPV